MIKQLPKTSGTDVLSSNKNLRKILWGGGGGGNPTPPPPPPPPPAPGIPTLLYVPGLNDPRKKPALIIVGKTGCQREN